MVSFARSNRFLQDFLAGFCPHQGRRVGADHHERNMFALERSLQLFTVPVGQHEIDHRDIERLFA
jgi:hypothetical protein